jgi:YD repeat-containing protein
MLPSEDADAASGLLLKVEDDQGRDVRYVLDATGRMHEAISNITYQNQSPVSYVKTKYTYDDTQASNYSRGLLAKIKNTWNSPHPMTGQWQETTLVQNEYTYRTDGIRLTNTVSDSSGPIRTEEYGYDALSRLTTVDYGDGETQSYTFDPMGNRT